jgi:PAS domain S-box-containing protein
MPEPHGLPVDADPARILHELLVHQVELELQNEELLEARAEVEENAARFTELYDFAPVGYFSISSTGRILQVNFMGARMLSKERSLLLGGHFAGFVSVGSRQPFERFLELVFAGEEAAPLELEITRHDQTSITLRLTAVLSPNGLACRMAAMDVTEQRRAETSAREKNEDLDRIFNLSQDFISIANMDGRFIRLNPAFERLLGHSVGELMNRDFLEFVHPDDRDATMQAMADLRGGKAVLDFVNRYRCRDGSYRWLEWRGVPFRGELICSLARDITARKETEDALRVSEEKFRSIVEASPMAMYLYQLVGDHRLVLVDANPAADRETGIRHDTLRGKTVEEAFPKLVGTGIPEMYREVARGNLGTQSFVIHYDEQGRISGHFEVSVFQTVPGAIVVAFTDISERIKIEEELKQTQDELETRVQRRTAQLQERTRQLRALAGELTQIEERERSRIAGLIHDDLQQTLVAASLSLGMMRSKLGNGETAADLDRIGAMIRESIAISRSLTAELSPPVLRQCGLAAAFKWLRTWCSEKYGLDVTVTAEEEVDPGFEISVALFRGVRELLFNIVKHSGVKSAELRMSRPAGGGLEIVVSDQGAGFDPEAARAREGISGGFGLFNLRERLELLGGKFGIESSPDAGSRFTLWVPVPAASPEVPAARDWRPAPGAPPPPSSCAPPSLKTRIVVADDHAAVRESLVRVLAAEPDLEVVGQAGDGEEALRLAGQLRPHFVVMDLNMPRLDGIEATAAIRREVPCVRVLGLSTHADAEHRTTMIRAGAVDLLHKNNSASEIISTLRSHASR